MNKTEARHIATAVEGARIALGRGESIVALHWLQIIAESLQNDSLVLRLETQRLAAQKAAERGRLPGDVISG